ncbi:MAG: GHKL domain-containing protein [Lachnospiraceae bacterium]|nr:GHKL domain-containing protein [Lachnospiraceae bacterium]
MYRVFELLINVFQSIMITHFLIKCLKIKADRRSTKTEYVVGFAWMMLYLCVLDRLLIFERMGIFATILITMAFCVLFLGGSFFEKLFYGHLMIGGLEFSSILGIGLISLATGLTSLGVIEPNTLTRYVAELTAQVFLYVYLSIIIKVRKYCENSDSKYINILSIVPMISVIVCSLVLYSDNASQRVRTAYTAWAVAGVVTINVICIILLIMENKMYAEKMREKLLLNAYEQKEKDVESILAMKRETDKFRHDIKKILTLTTELMDDGEYKKASEVLHQYIDNKDFTKEVYINSGNVLLDYMLNRKIKQCKEADIESKCFIMGTISGIEDVDMYILLENLIDNAIEATIQSDKPYIELNIYANESTTEVVLGNCVKGNILKDNPNLNTTKNDKEKHGLGLENVKEIVEKYDGIMTYEMKLEEYIEFRVILNKN